ncbi:uroporphyrin-III methyltransferase [Sulfuricaulis limicola]|uniref:Uroporphyrin-III methyltransferase n=1 Tax=Sulfuricaulis limicola TaxID=1620215 RepID=A0A1B4XJN6_9GAMM|nr:DUF488 family protein [Sulfuricaulis limicola]BAV35006.1 uroporphyrin-III methyltransferase [Sulfuricaulis limicola]
MSISVKRVYDPPSPADGLRVLVDRLWPRGLSKSTARIDLWARELAPSTELRRWYAHEAEKWPGFKRRFFTELAARTETLDSLRRETRKRKVTLLFASKEPRLNNAFALKQFLEARARTQRRPAAKHARGGRSRSGGRQ